MINVFLTINNLLLLGGGDFIQQTVGEPDHTECWKYIKLLIAGYPAIFALLVWIFHQYKSAKKELDIARKEHISYVEKEIDKWVEFAEGD